MRALRSESSHHLGMRNVAHLFARELRCDLLDLGLVEVILVQDKCAWEDVAEQASQGRLAARRSPADPHQNRLLLCHDLSVTSELRWR